MTRVIGIVHETGCACGGRLSVSVVRLEMRLKQYAAAVERHQQTQQHRAWADGPGFEKWRNE